MDLSVVRMRLEKRERLSRLNEELGREVLLERHPEAAGYLRDPHGYRLFERREELIARLDAELAPRVDDLYATTRYPIALEEDNT